MAWTYASTSGGGTKPDDTDAVMELLESTPRSPPTGAPETARVQIQNVLVDVASPVLEPQGGAQGQDLQVSGVNLNDLLASSASFVTIPGATQMGRELKMSTTKGSEAVNGAHATLVLPLRDSPTGTQGQDLQVSEVNLNDLIASTASNLGSFSPLGSPDKPSQDQVRHVNRPYKQLHNKPSLTDDANVSLSHQLLVPRVQAQQQPQQQPLQLQVVARVQREQGQRLIHVAATKKMAVDGRGEQPGLKQVC